MKLDFPFYNDNPRIRTIDILILAIIPILFTIYTFVPFSFPGGIAPFVFCLSELAAFLYVAKGKISLIVQKPKLIDYVRIIVTLILQYIFAIGLAMILRYVLKIGITDNEVVQMNMDYIFWIKIIIQLFGEELYKLLVFLVTLILMYKYTKKRKLSIVVATTVALSLFGLLHMTTYNNLIQILLLQSLASLFSFYNYLKTKNILTAYFQHFLFDAIPFILTSIIM